MNHRAAILLAGGLSSRMISFKPLLRLGEETITDRAISLFAQNNVDVYLVVGWQKNKLISGIKNRDVHIIENPDFEEGMFTSVRAGLRHVGNNYIAFFILPVDIPLVRAFSVRRLIEASDRHPEKILYPVFNRMRGHPPLIPTGLIPHILHWQNEGGLISALAPYENMVEEIIVPDRNITFDIDTPEDYKNALDRFQHYQIPTDEECEVILNTICQVDSDRRRHSFKVAEVASRISQALIEAGRTVDKELVRASTILHDIAREKPQHDIAGGQLLCQMGFEKVGRIVAVHTFLSSELTENYLEAQVVYLADKFVQGDSVVTLDVRFDSAHRRYGSTSEIEKKITLRRQHAQVIKKELETMIGKPIEPIIFN
jgi:molybdenum cofactor cytidylyltransferase